MDLIAKRSNHTPACEMTFPVTLSFSGVVKDQPSVRKNIFDALVSWVENGPGFISENDDSYTIAFTVQDNMEA